MSDDYAFLPFVILGANDFSAEARKCVKYRAGIRAVEEQHFLLLYCPSDRHTNVREALSDLKELPFALERDGTKVILNARR